MARPIFDEGVYREALTRWEVNADRASAERILAGVGVVLRMLDKARGDLDNANDTARSYRLNCERLERRTAAVRAVAENIHSPGCTPEAPQAGCPGCRVLAAVLGLGLYGAEPTPVPAVEAGQ